jgi:mRNA interferase RelE/StbE
VTRKKHHRVDLAPAAERQLRKLPPGDAARLRGPILALAMEPRPPDAVRLASTDLWRLRIGELRVVYLVDDEDRVVTILRAARRSESTYRRLP